MALVRRIPVTDGNGDQVTIFEFEDRRFLRKVRWLKLDTGETVEPAGMNMFVIVATGERFTRVA